MSSRIRRRCTADAYCPNPALPGGACAEHKVERESRRDTSARRGYGPKWVKRRRAFLLEHPYCEVPGCHAPAEVADHVEGRKALIARGIADPDLDEHLVAMCRPHHSEATNRFEGGFGNPINLEEKLRWLGRSSTSKETSA